MSEFGDPQAELSEDDRLDDDRPIPEIPGVENSESGTEDWGTLHGELDEESSEDVLDDIAAIIRLTMANFGVEDADEATKEEIIQLWHKMDMDEHLVTDLILYTTTAKRNALRNDNATLMKDDLIDKSESLINPYEIRTKLVEQTAPNLMKLGYGRLDAFRLSRRTHTIGQLFRIEGWLLGLPLMAEFPEQVKSIVRAAPGQKITAFQLFEATHSELTRQARIIHSAETRDTYDHRVSYEAQAYEELRRTVNSAYKIADAAFSRFVRQ